MKKVDKANLTLFIYNVSTHCIETVKWLESRWTVIETLSKLGGVVVTHPLCVKEVTGSIPGSGNSF